MLVEEFHERKKKKNLDYGDLVESLGAVAVRPHGKERFGLHTTQTELRARNKHQSHNVLLPKHMRETMQVDLVVSSFGLAV